MTLAEIFALKFWGP